MTGALGAKISEKVEVASDYGLTDKGNTYTATLNLKGLGDSRSHLSFQNAFDPSYAGAMFSAAFMQAVSKTLSFGGQGMYIAHQGVLVNSYGGMYDDGENCFAVQQGGAVRTPPKPLSLPLCACSCAWCVPIEKARKKAYGISLSSDLLASVGQRLCNIDYTSPRGTCTALHSL